MSTQHDDGGEAFPRPRCREFADEAKGMTLRDWFAGQALAGMAIDEVDPVLCSSWAYKIADAMIAARSK